MNLKKKILVTVSSLFFVGILVVGFFGVSNVIAGQTSPNMKATIKTENINTLNGMNFNVDIEINPGEVKVDNYKNQDIYLSFSNDNTFKLVSASENGKILEIDEDQNKIKVDNFEYKKSGDVYKAEAKTIRLTFKANGRGIFKGERSIDRSLKLNYTDVSGSKVEKISMELTNGRKSLDTKIDNLVYAPKDIIGFEKEIPSEIESGAIVDLEYKFPAGELKLAANESYEGEMTTQLESKKRVIYVVEQSVLDENGGNGEIARDSIIKGAQSLMDKSPNIETSLVAYGENAKVVQSNKKDFYPVNELMDNLSSLEVKEENGNLGEALKVATMLAETDKSYETTIIVVSAGNPLYITEKDNEMLKDISDEKGKAKFSEELAGEYANKVANEIVVEFNDNINWFGINYGLETGQNVSTELIQKLNGTASTVKKPYSDDFIAIIEDSMSDFKIRGTVDIELLNSALATENELTDIPMDFYYNVKRDENGKEVKDQEGNIILEASKSEKIINLPVTVSGTSKIDLANKENIKVTYTSENFAKEKKEVIYNNDEIISRDIEVKSLFTVHTKGFNTGRASGQIIQGNITEANLAIENSFGLAFEITLDDKIDISTVEAYVSDTLNNKITVTKRDTLSLGDNRYVVRIDCNIGSVELGKVINVGFKIGEVTETIKITTVDKPEHF